MKPKLFDNWRYQLPHPSQMGGTTDNMTLGGCIMNGILALFFGILALSCMGVHL